MKLHYSEFLGTMQQFVNWWNEFSEDNARIIWMKSHMRNYCTVDPANPNKAEVGEMPVVEYVYGDKK